MGGAGLVLVTSLAMQLAIGLAMWLAVGLVMQLAMGLLIGLPMGLAMEFHQELGCLVWFTFELQMHW